MNNSRINIRRLLQIPIPPSLQSLYIAFQSMHNSVC